MVYYSNTTTPRARHVHRFKATNFTYKIIIIDTLKNRIIKERPTLSIFFDTYKYLSDKRTNKGSITLTQEAITKNEPTEISMLQEFIVADKKKQLSIQELVESLKNTVDDIGQTGELASEELVTKFFTSFVKLMKTRTPSISASEFALPTESDHAVQAHVDPTEHLVLQYTDRHVKLEDLSEEKNRDLILSSRIDCKFIND